MLEQPYLYRGYCRTGWVIYHELVKSFLPRTWPVTCHKTIPSNVRSRTRHFFKLPQIVAGHCKFQPIWPWPSKRFSARAVCIIPECWTSLTSVIHSVAQRIRSKLRFSLGYMHGTFKYSSVHSRNVEAWMWITEYVTGINACLMLACPRSRQSNPSKTLSSSVAMSRKLTLAIQWGYLYL